MTSGLTFEFESALNTGGTCNLNYYVMVKIMKSGTDYTIEELGQFPDVSPLVGTYSGTDFVGGVTGEYPSEVVTQVNADMTIGITELGFGWMVDFWGETVVQQSEV